MKRSLESAETGVLCARMLQLDFLAVSRLWWFQTEGDMPEQSLVVAQDYEIADLLP